MQIIQSIESLKNQSIKQSIDQRMLEFEDLGKKDNNEYFKEMCFCFMTANYSAEGGIRIQNEIGDGFIHLTEEELSTRLKELGHRFPKARASYVVEARNLIPDLKEKINSFKHEENLREWVVENVKGLGYKESSHFLRNIGYKDLAILDFHIIDLLVKNDLIERPKTLTRNRYLEIEKILRDIGKQTDLNLAELDLYLWYMETGKVLK